MQCAGRHTLPPRAHNHNGFSSTEPPCVASPPPLPLSRTVGSVVRLDPSPASLLDRFRPATSLGGGVAAGRYPAELAVNGMPPPSLEPVSMTSRRALTSRGHVPTSSTIKTHRAIKCYHCRMCEQVPCCRTFSFNWHFIMLPLSSL